MNKQMNGELFDLVLQHALFDCRVEDIEKIDKEMKDKPILSKAFETFFHKFIAKRKRIAFAHKLPKYTRVAAVFVVSIISIFSCILVVQPPVLAAVQNVFYEWGNAFVEYKSVSSGVKNSPYYGIMTTYVPQDYKLLEASIQPDGITTVTYSNFNTKLNKAPIFKIFCLNMNNNFNSQIDNEHGVKTEITIKDATDVLFIKSTFAEYPSHLVWSKDNCFYKMYCPYDFTTEEIKKIAEGVKLVR